MEKTIRGLEFSAEEVENIEAELAEVATERDDGLDGFALPNEVVVTENHTIIGDRDHDSYARIVSHGDGEEASMYLKDYFTIADDIVSTVEDIIEETNGYNSSNFVVVDTEGEGAEDHTFLVGLTEGTQSSGEPLKTLTEQFTLSYVSSNGSFNFYVEEERDDIAATFFFTEE